MKFTFEEAVNAKESGKYLEPGIKDVKFLGITKDTIVSQKNNEEYNVMSVKFDIPEYGEYTQNFFEPKDDERRDGMYGKNPSPKDHFQITVIQILEALAPEFVKKLQSGEESLDGTFTQIVNTIKKQTEPAIGKETKIKLIPQNNGFAAMPSFTAKLDKAENLGIQTRIIGDKIFLSASEMKKINAAKEAKPTDMTSKSDDVLDAVKADAEDSDLPF